MNEVWYAEVRPDSQIINEDVYMALLEAAMASDAPLTADEVSGIVEAFGFDRQHRKRLRCKSNFPPPQNRSKCAVNLLTCLGGYEDRKDNENYDDVQ